MNRHNQNRNRRQSAFTLIEMLVVVAIIGILAGLLLSAFPAMQEKRAKNRAKAEVEKLDTLIQAYHSHYNSFPLDNPDKMQAGHNAIHPLYYELMGSTFNASQSRYETVSENISEANVRTYFNQDGLRNVTHDVNNPESPKAKQFFTSLNSDAFRSLDTGSGGPDVKLLHFTVKDLDANMLKDSSGALFNPWRYIATNPTNNQGRYDLWVEFEVGGSRFRASNWEKDVITLERPAK